MYLITRTTGIYKDKILTYSDNARVHYTTKNAPFSHLLAGYPPSTIFESIATAISTDMVGPFSTGELQIRVLDNRRYMSGKSNDRILFGQAACKCYFDKKARGTK